MQIKSTRITPMKTPAMPGVANEVVSNKDILVSADQALVRAARQPLPTQAKLIGSQYAVGHAGAGIGLGTRASVGGFTFQGGQKSDTADVRLLLKAAGEAADTYFPTLSDVAPVPFDVFQVSLSSVDLADRADKFQDGTGSALEVAVGVGTLGVDLMSALSHAIPGLNAYLPHAQFFSMLLQVTDEAIVPYYRVDYRLSQD